MCVLISPPKIFGAVCHKQLPASARAQCRQGSLVGSRDAPTRTARQAPHLLGELDDQWQLVVLDEVQQLLLGDLPLEVVPAFVELWEEEA